MWGAAAGAAVGALAAAVLVLLLCRRSKSPPPSPGPHPPVQLVVKSLGDARVLLAPGPRAARAGRPRAPPPAPPPTRQCLTRAPPPPPRLPPDLWPRHPAAFSTLTRPLASIVNSLGVELREPAVPRKFSATRSPSLEKDDKSPFIRTGETEAFGFDAETVRKLSTEEDMSERATGSGGAEPTKDNMSPSNLRRFMSVSTRLNVCTMTDSNPQLETTQERSEMQNSPRILECSSAKEKSAASKFDFSPKILADSFSTPRFFTPPEVVSPLFFTEPSPKSVYYDTVRSPKFFPETPRDGEVAQSPRTLGDHFNRSNGFSEKSSSPRILSARPSPKVHSCNKENYFTFDHVSIVDETASRLSPRPRKYGGRSSLEKERHTPPMDKDIKKYRRHNSCDTNYRNVELNITNPDSKDITTEADKIDKDVVDCCAKMECIDIDVKAEIEKELLHIHPSSADIRRQRLQSISLDSENARIIELNLGIPVAKQMKDQMNEAYKNHEISNSCESIERFPKTPTVEQPSFEFEDETKPKTPEEDEEESKSPDIMQKKTLRHSSNTQSFLDMPRFSPKEFEITVTSDEGMTTSAEAQTKRKGKNLRNLTIDLSKRDSDLEKELLEFEKLYTDSEEIKVKTPTLKVKATSLDSSETINFSLPQKKTLEVPQNSVSVPNTPKRQIKRILATKNVTTVGKLDQRRLYMKGQDSGIFLRENHANLMLYQPGTSRMGSRAMGSFDENTTGFIEKPPEISVSGASSRSFSDSSQNLGANLLNYKQNLSVSSTNLKTLPEGQTVSDDYEPSVEDEKPVKKLHRRNSNQSLKLSSHSLQGSNCSLNSGASYHNLTTVRTSISNFSLNSESRQKRFSLDRRDSYTAPNVAEHLTPTTRVICSSNTSLTGESSKNCLLQRRGSNNSLTLNICSTNNLSRHSSNSSLNKESKPFQKKGLLERRSSNTSLTLNINTSNPQLSVNKGLSISNYNLNGSTCNLSRYQSNQSMDNPIPPAEPKKGILERRSSNTSLTLNIQPQEPRDLEIDESLIDPNLKDLPHRDKHRKSLSTENLLPKSYKTRMKLRSSDKCLAFGSHDNLWSSSFAVEQDYPQNLTYVGGDQENEIIYAFGHQEEPDYQQGFVRNITTKPLSPQSTSEDFRLYLANMQHLQNASSVLTRQQLRDLNDVFQNGYSKVKCPNSSEGQHSCSGRVQDIADVSTEDTMVDPDSVMAQPCSEYQKMLLRNLHQEFWDMPTNFQEKPIVSGSHPKNRYKTILPNEHSRFLLQPDPGATEGYINANFIKGHEYTRNYYIATQGPLQNTIYDFWIMVLQNDANFKCQEPLSRGIQKIVMLTNFIENNRQKCEKYFPLELHEESTFVSLESCSDEEANSCTIKNIGIIKKSCYTIRKLSVCHSSCGPESAITVYHYWFHNWADHKCPKDVNALLNLSLDILKNTTFDFSEMDSDNDVLCKCNDSPKGDFKFIFPPLENQSGKCDVKVNISSPVDFSKELLSPPTIIHCSAGIGRTGCLIAILNGIKQLINDQKVDVLGIVCNMRLNRGGMVQNSEQYELIHKVLCVFEQVCLPPL